LPGGGQGLAAVVGEVGAPAPKLAAVPIKDWLLKEIADHPALLTPFPTLKGWLERKGKAELTTPWDIARVLFWLADAARRQPVGPCRECECPDDGVPLARVWLGPDDTGRTVV